MRKLLLIIVFSLVFTLSASPEFWLEGAFIADRNFVSEEIAASFPAMGESVAEIKSLGFSVDFALFPSQEVRVGFAGGYNIMLPVGRALTGGSNEGYITYDLDNRQSLFGGLAYYQFFTDRIGMALTCGFEYSWYRTALEHVANDNEPMDFVYEEEFGVMGEAGIVSQSKNMYFKLGLRGYYDLRHTEDPGFRLALSVGGGFIIG